MSRPCRELGLCQVSASLAFDRPCPQPCAECDLRVTPIVVDGATVAVEVSQRAHSAATDFPFAPGVIEAYRRSPARRVPCDIQAVAALIALSAVVGLLAGIARGRGWL